MNSKELSSLYFRATSRAISELELLYEELHTTSGDAVTDIDRATTLSQACIQRIRHELELIKSSVTEYNRL